MASLSNLCLGIPLILAASLTSARSPYLTDSSDNGAYPSWQSVYPGTTSRSTQATIQLFGDHGPNWTLSSTDGVYKEIPVKIPGDILSDLLAANIIGDPYFDRNLWTQRRVWMGPYDGPSWNGTNRVLEQRTRTWEYETKIPATDLLGASTNYVLVIEGIKMGARITWDGLTVAPDNITSQFLRYMLPINITSSNDLLYHTLTVTFDPSIATGGRFMACSGGWDWAPYVWEGDERGSRTLTFGISNPIYLVAYESVLITDVTPRISYSGEYPRQPLLNGPQADFLVAVTVHLSWPQGGISVFPEYQILLESDFSDRRYIQSVRTLSQEITITMTASDVKLWWPNGLGEQPLYNIKVSLLSNAERVGSVIRKRIGFRTLALVTANDTDDTIFHDMVNNNLEGTGNHGMFFRINGAPIWSRGANVIPMDQLEGRIHGDAARLMVQSAAKANMNMLRVWGGGAIPPDEFYEACDEEGILLYHDLMFVEEGSHGATSDPVVSAEIEHIVWKLAAHPSIVLWNGCNECGYGGGSLDVYESFVMVTVAKADGTRPIWPSSPSAHGWEKGVRMLDGLPNGLPLKIRTTRGREIERHGPYVRGFSFNNPSVNGADRPGSNETMIPMNFTSLVNNTVGVSALNFFVSEFGASVFSSFDSMSVTLPPDAWGIHGGEDPDECKMKRFSNANTCNGTNPMAERNYAADNRIDAYFGGDNLDEVGEDVFSLQLYHSMMAQTFWVKGQVEMMRARNSFGTLLWQLNENWPTGGWGSLEYGPNHGMVNQVAGGRWKPLMYVFQSRTFQDISVCCGADSLCYAVNDSLNAALITVTVEAWNVTLSSPLRTTQTTIRLPVAASRQVEFFELPKGFTDDSDLLLLLDKESNVIDVSLQVLPKNLAIMDASCSVELSLLRQSIQLQVSCSNLALYVWLSTAAEGWFSDNAFHLKPGSTKTISFDLLPGRQSLDFDAFLKSLRILHLGSKAPQRPADLFIIPAAIDT